FEILEREQAALLLRKGDDIAGDRSLVKGVAAALRDGAVRLREAGIAEDLAGPRRPAVDQVGAGCVGAPGQRPSRCAPVTGDDLADRETILGVADGWFKDFVEGQCAESLAERLPAVHAAGNRPAERSSRRNLLEALLGEHITRRGIGRTAAGVE